MQHILKPSTVFRNSALVRSSHSGNFVLAPDLSQLIFDCESDSQRPQIFTDKHCSSGRMENCEDFREFMELLLRRRVPIGYMLSGSVAELPLQYAIANLTDFDHMNFYLDLCAISPTDPFPEKFHGYILLVKTDNTYPGFARLKFSNNSRGYFKRWQMMKSYSPGPARKGPLMSSFELKRILSGEERRRFQRQLEDYEITTADLVACVFCPIWPNVTVEWIRRQRSNGWPTKELLSKVVHGGCHFVAKAHPSCPTDQTLFRFSFSSAEIVLVNSWSAIQKYIYHILRLIKSSVEIQCKEKRLESAISSYTMKTLMLWSCEDKPPSFWSKGFIITSVTQLVLELIEWLCEGRCQNYFIPCYNMFEYPKGDVDLTIQILSSFACNESEITAITAKWPIAYPETYFPFELSDKLSMLAQFGISRLSHFVNPLEPNSDNSFDFDQIKAGGCEFKLLVTGLVANFQAAVNKRVGLHQTHSDGDLVRTARFHLDQSMRTTTQGTTQTVFYLGKSILGNLSFLFERNKSGPRRLCIYTRKEEASMQTAGLIQKETNKKQVPPGLNIVAGIAVHFLLEGFDKSLPKTSYFTSVAYRANFYFTYLEEYVECLRMCEDAEKHFNDLTQKIGVGNYYDEACSVVLTSKWSVIFDQCIQTVFGFILLREYFLESQLKESRKSDSLYSFVIYISPMTFISYFENQCNLRLRRLPTAQDLLDQYLDCSILLVGAICTDQLVQLTTESQKILSTFSKTVAKGILNSNM